MCDICEKARRAPQREALNIIGRAMQDRANRGRACLDELVGELVGQKPSKDDALARAESLEDLKR